MRTEVSPEQIQEYREKGFLQVEQFLNVDELSTWRAHVDSAVAERRDRKLPDREGRNKGTYYDNVFKQRLQLWMDHERMRELMFDARIGKIACDLEGIEGIRIWHDQALIKEPWANPTAWHLDVPYWSFSSKNAISIWVALDDATYHNGCLYFIVGSHKITTYDNVDIDENMVSLFNLYPDLAGKPAEPVPMRAGDCSFHNGLMAHGAGANMTPGFRRAMTCAYMPDGATFNGTPNWLPDDYRESLCVGDVLDNDELNPLIYHRSRPHLG